MLKKAILPLLLILPINSILSQNTSKLDLYTNIRLLDELHLGLSYQLNERIGLAFELGYNFKYKDYTYSETGSLLRADRLHISLVDQGPVLSASINMNLSDKGYISFTYAFRNLKADRLIYDPGLSGGSTVSEYSEYSTSSSNHGFELNYNRIIKKFTIYGGLAFRHASTWKYYTLEGSVQMPFPSDREELVQENYLVLNLGVKYILFSKSRNK